MEITVKVKNVYGVEKVYPVCAKALLFANIAGALTLTPEVLRKIRELGYSVVVEAQKLPGG